MNRIILIVVMVFCAILISVALVPALWSDSKLRNQELVSSSGSYIDEAKCRTRLVVSFCQISVRGGGFPKFYMITGLGSDDTVKIMVPKGPAGARATSSTGGLSPAGPQGFTTNIGQTYFVNRLLTYLVSLSISLGIALSATRGWIRGL